MISVPKKKTKWVGGEILIHTIQHTIHREMSRAHEGQNGSDGSVKPRNIESFSKRPEARRGTWYQSNPHSL